MDKIHQDIDCTLQLLVTGMHLSPEFGNTYKLIQQDGFTIDEKVEMLLSSDSANGICKSMGLGLIGFSESLQRLIPDIAIILGDRFESMAMACACVNHRIPVAHIHGGETTQGVVDEAFRHSITKMSHLHFTSTEEYRRRVIQLGEQPDRVFNVGAIGVENIRKLPLLSQKELEKEIGFDLGKRFFLVTFHPVTLENATAEEQCKNLLTALAHFVKDHRETKIIFTKANADTDGRIINQLVDRYVAKNPNQTIAFTSMGQLRYLSAMKHTSAVIGNSSSGIIEAPSFNVPTINIGDRQKGRVQAASIIDCEPNKDAIVWAIEKSLSNAFQKELCDIKNLYEKPDTSLNILRIIKKTDLHSIIKKEFFDIQ
jgi:UDP-hydrolysing UDP-N-acetyl-D-glucosamine 2-epimerase